MRFVQLDTAGSISVDLAERPDASPTFVVYDTAGGTKASGTATVDSVDTTLSGAAAAGASSVTVASATGITVGRDYLIGGSEETGGQVVTVKSIASTTITLVRPLTAARASGVAFQSSRVTVSFASTVPTIVGRNWRTEVTFTVAAAARPKAVIPFDVVRYVPVTYLSRNDVETLDPIFTKRLAAGVWFPSVSAQAWDMVLHRLASKVAPGAIAGTLDLTIPHGYLVRSLILETAGGEEFAAMRDDMRKRYGEELETALTATAIDNDQDGAIEPNEGWYRFIPLSRG